MKNLLSAFLFFPVIAFAQEQWEYIGSSVTKDKYYIRDIQKKEYSNNLVFWTKNIKPDRIVKTKKGNVTKKGDYFLTKYEGNCSEKTLKYIMIAVYDSNGTSKETNTGPFFDEPVIPESMGEAILLTACDKFHN